MRTWLWGHTIKSARIVKDSKLHGKYIIATAGVGLTAISGVANLSSSTIESTGSSQQGNSVEGIWGVQYRKVICKLTHWSSEVQLKLKDNQWKMPWSVRGQDNTIQHVAEADIGEAAEPDPADSDDEDEEPPESFFVYNTNDSEEVVEEFVLFHEPQREEED